MESRLLLNRKTALLALVACLGFGLLQGARLLDMNSGPYSAHPYALVGLSIDGLTFVCVAVLSYFGRIDKAQPLFRAAIVASVAYAVLVAIDSNPPIALVCMQITAGAGWSLAVLCWMEVFTSYRPLYALPLIAISYVIDVALPPLTRMIFPGSQLMVLLVVFVLSMVALRLCLRSNTYVASVMKEAIVPRTSMAEALSRTKRAVAGTFAISLVCGFVIELDLFNGLQYAQADLTSLFTVIIALSMTAALLIFRPRKANIDYISPLVVLFLVSILLYRNLDSADSYAAGSLMVSFLITFYVLLWLMLVSEAYERKLPAFFLLGLALGVARLSVALGRFVAQTLLEQGALDIHLALMGGIWVLVATLSLVFCSYLRYAAKLRMPALDEASDQTPLNTVGTPTKEVWEQLTTSFQLTNREREITSEFAAGRSARYIADQLVLSEHTVKTHLRHAYAKMDVHSRQELLDLIEEFLARAERREESSARVTSLTPAGPERHQ